MDLSGYITSSEARLQEVERAISAFDFTKGDQNQYQQLNREYQKIKRLMVVWNEYQKVVKNLKDNREMRLQGDHQGGHRVAGKGRTSSGWRDQGVDSADASQ